MTVAETPNPAASPITRPVWTVVAVLLALYAVMALAASTRKGQSFDEGEQIAVGYNIWLRHDFRMEAANGDFAKRWATLPLLISKPAFVGTDNVYWRHGEPYAVAYDFFFRSGNRPESLLLQCRSMMVLLGMATGFLVFLCSREIFGSIGGLFSLTLFVFSPHMLAFGAMVATAMTICPTLLGSTWSIWRLLHDITWGRLLLSLVFFGLLLLSKLSALLIFPITAVLIGVKLISGRPLAWHLGSTRLIESRTAQIGVIGGLIVVHAFIGWGSIWAHYHFRYAASPNPGDPGIVLAKQTYTDPDAQFENAVIAWCRRAHFLPEGYLYGVESLLGESDDREAYMDEKWNLGGWRAFFPHSMWEKSTPTFLVFISAGLGTWWWRRHVDRIRRHNSKTPPSMDTVPPFYGAIPFVTLIAIYFGVAVIQDVNIGHRHILPIYPAMYVLAGSITLVWSTKKIWPKAVIALLLLFRVFNSLETHPYYLAYFNPLAGGPSQGYKHLVDSSLDWGMNLPDLKRWLRQNNTGDREPFFLAYFGTDSPEYYHIKSKRLPGFFDWRPQDVYPLTPGIYAISATLYESVYTRTFGPWNKVYERWYQHCLQSLEDYDKTANNPPQRAALLKKYSKIYWENQYKAFENLRFGRLCAWLRHNRDPDDNVGYSILIWRLDATTLHDALFGPPAELEETPVVDEAAAMPQPTTPQ